MRSGANHTAPLSVLPIFVPSDFVSSGQVMPPAEVSLESLITSNIVEIAKREGDEVKAGELLLRLDDREQPLLFHRTVGLRDEWAAIQKRQGGR